jgi:hypothetical protein
MYKLTKFVLFPPLIVLNSPPASQHHCHSSPYCPIFVILTPTGVNDLSGTIPTYGTAPFTTYWKAEQSQPLYDSGTTPQQSNKNKEMESTIATNIQDDEANDYLSKQDQLDESIHDESMRSYDFDDNKSMTRQEELFATISQIIRQFQEANDVNEPSVTWTKEEVTDDDQPTDGFLWQIADQDELLRILSARIDAL